MARHPSWSVPLLLPSVIGLAGCSGRDSPPSSGLGPYPVPQTVEAGEVIAEVGPVTFTTGEIERRLKSMSPFARSQLAGREQLEPWIENEIRLEAIAQRAWADKIQEDPEVLDQIRQLLVGVYTKRAMESDAASLEPTMAELNEAYEARYEEFNKPGRVRLSQIVRYVDGPSERRKARKLLEKVQREVLEGQKRNNHKVFANAAREHSQDDATKMGAGDLSYLTRDELTARYGKDVADTTFDTAKIGDLFVADAPNAVVLLKKTGARRAIERTLEQVRPQLRNLLIQQKRRDRLDAWALDVMARSGVSIDPRAMAKVKLPEPTVGTPTTGSKPTGEAPGAR